MDSLIRYSLEFVWSINKLQTDPVCELKYGDDVAYKPKALLELSVILCVVRTIWLDLANWESSCSSCVRYNLIDSAMHRGDNYVRLAS